MAAHLLLRSGQDCYSRSSRQTIDSSADPAHSPRWQLVVMAVPLGLDSCRLFVRGGGGARMLLLRRLRRLCEPGRLRVVTSCHSVLSLRLRQAPCPVSGSWAVVARPPAAGPAYPTNSPALTARHQPRLQPPFPHILPLLHMHYQAGQRRARTWGLGAARRGMRGLSRYSRRGVPGRCACRRGCHRRLRQWGGGRGSAALW